MQIKGLSHRLLHATFCSNQQFQAAGIPQPLWAPAPAFGCFPGKFFLHISRSKFSVLQILPVAYNPSTPGEDFCFHHLYSLQLILEGIRFLPKPFLFCWTNFSLTLSPCIMCPSDSPQIFGAFLVLGAQNWAQCSSRGLTRAAHRELCFCPLAHAAQAALGLLWGLFELDPVLIFPKFHISVSCWECCLSHPSFHSWRGGRGKLLLTGLHTAHQPDSPAHFHLLC